MDVDARGCSSFNLHVCRHSVTVVASTRYPEQMAQTMCSFSVLNLILRSILDTEGDKGAGKFMATR